jgi:hypothetical protein
MLLPPSLQYFARQLEKLKGDGHELSAAEFRELNALRFRLQQFDPEYVKLLEEQKHARRQKIILAKFVLSAVWLSVGFTYGAIYGVLLFGLLKWLGWLPGRWGLRFYHGVLAGGVLYVLAMCTQLKRRNYYLPSEYECAAT